MNGLQIVTRELDNRTICISLKGFVDSYSCSELEQAVNWLFEHHFYSFVVDLSRVDGINCKGFGVLFGALAKAKRNHGNIVMLRPSTDVKYVFSLLGLTHIFSITDNLPAACASLTG